MSLDAFKFAPLVPERPKSKRNRGDRRGQKNRARARKAGVVSTLSARDWLLILKRFCYRCAYCGEPGELTQDHKTPIHHGGAHTFENVVPCCGSCNSRKGVLTAGQFFEKMLLERIGL